MQDTSWGLWFGRRHYSLHVVQHPLRARMCGFGDKDRRPLAPAAVAKLVVRREDNSLVDVDELDSSFFLVTVDLWSADAKREMNLVLHPSSSIDRHVATVSAKPKKSRASVASPRSDHPSPPSSHSTPNSASDQPVITTVISTDPSSFSYAPTDPSIPDAIPFSNSAAYNTSPDSPDGWAYHPLRNPQRTPMPTADPWMTDSSSFRTWPTPDASSYQPSVYSNHDIDRPYQPDSREYHQWNQQDSYTTQYDIYGYPPQQSPQYYQTNYPQNNPSSPSSSSSPHPVPHSLPRHVYTRTLVGPLSSNACRLLDEHQTPGIFFLFQDLSVRTEGTFRLRLRLMNVGDSPTPEAGALRVHTNVSPVLAQTFTEPFIVFSAKRFPGVPETTALSIAFGNQGQKLPLRNRHGTAKHGRRSHREGDSDGSESSDDT